MSDKTISSHCYQIQAHPVHGIHFHLHDLRKSFLIWISLSLSLEGKNQISLTLDFLNRNISVQ